MCFMAYPVTGASAVGLLNWGSTRLSQMSYMNWANIETSAGVYSPTALANLDAIVTHQRQNGASVYMGLYCTPRFYADNTTPNPTYTDYDTRGPWNYYGECAQPTSLAAVRAFVQMLVQRYNLPGGAWFDQYGAALGKGMQYWEPWNEPPVAVSSNNTNAVGPGTKATTFYWGSKNQLVDLCWEQYAAIKELDPSVVVTSPGFTGGVSSFIGFYTTGGTAYPAKLGKDSSEVAVFHPYNRTPPFMRWGSWSVDLLSDATGSSGIPSYRNQLDAAGLSGTPIWVSEWGVESGTSIDMGAWYAAPAVVRYRWMLRMLISFAAHGVKQVHPWHWLETGAVGNSGDWQLDTEGVQKAYNYFAANITGETITRVKHYLDGSLTLYLANGKTITV